MKRRKFVVPISMLILVSSCEYCKTNTDHSRNDVVGYSCDNSYWFDTMKIIYRWCCDSSKRLIANVCQWSIRLFRKHLLHQTIHYFRMGVHLFGSYYFRMLTLLFQHIFDVCVTGKTVSSVRYNRSILFGSFVRWGCGHTVIGRKRKNRSKELMQ